MLPNILEVDPKKWNTTSVYRSPPILWCRFLHHLTWGQDNECISEFSSSEHRSEVKRLESHRPFGPVDRNVAKRALELFIASSVISPCGRDHHDECSWLDPIQIYEKGHSSGSLQRKKKRAFFRRHILR